MLSDIIVYTLLQVMLMDYSWDIQSVETILFDAAASIWIGCWSTWNLSSYLAMWL